jgi:hypothetical protein
VSAVPACDFSGLGGPLDFVVGVQVTHGILAVGERIGWFVFSTYSVGRGRVYVMHHLIFRLLTADALAYFALRPVPGLSKSRPAEQEWIHSTFRPSDEGDLRASRCTGV